MGHEMFFLHRGFVESFLELTGGAGTTEDGGSTAEAGPKPAGEEAKPGSSLFRGFSGFSMSSSAKSSLPPKAGSATAGASDAAGRPAASESRGGVDSLLEARQLLLGLFTAGSHFGEVRAPAKRSRGATK